MEQGRGSRKRPAWGASGHEGGVGDAYGQRRPLATGPGQDRRRGGVHGMKHGRRGFSMFNSRQVGRVQNEKGEAQRKQTGISPTGRRSGNEIGGRLRRGGWADGAARGRAVCSAPSAGQARDGKIGAARGGGRRTRDSIYGGEGRGQLSGRWRSKCGNKGRTARPPWRLVCYISLGTEGWDSSGRGSSQRVRRLARRALARREA